MSTSKKLLRRKRIRNGIRKKIRGTASRPRLSVFRSNKVIYAQLVDDINGVTLASANSLGITGPKVEAATEVGKKIASAAKSAGIETVVFDRGGNQYHGRVKALGDGAREAGLAF